MLPGLNASFWVYFLAGVLAIIYTLIPNENYWIYELVKNQYWDVLIIISFVEIFEMCLPGLSSKTYLASYLTSFFIPIIIRVGSYFSSVRNNFALSTVVQTISLLAPIFFYGLDVFQCRDFHGNVSPPQDPSVCIQSEFSPRELVEIFELGPSRKAVLPSTVAVQESVLFDMFACSVNRDTMLNASSSSLFAVESPLAIDAGDSRSINAGKEIAEVNGNNSTSAMQTSANFVDTREQISLDSGISYSRQAWQSMLQQVLDRRVSGKSASTLTWNWLPQLPRYYWQQNYNFRSEITGDRRELWLLATCFNCTRTLYFYFLIFFTEYFRLHAAASSHYVILFFTYVAVNNFGKLIMKRIGLAADLRKKGTISMYFLGEIHSLLFYYTFYRILFESISSWGVFFAFQAIHFASEWILYPFRVSKLLHSALMHMKSNGFLIGSRIVYPKNTNRRDWLDFVALDFALRCTVMVVSGLVILTLLVIVTYVPWITNDLKESNQHDMLNSCIFISLAVILEAINAGLINILFFSRQGINIWAHLNQFFSDSRFRVLVCIVAAILFINPIYAFTTDNVY